MHLPSRKSGAVQRRSPSESSARLVLAVAIALVTLHIVLLVSSYLWFVRCGRKPVRERGRHRPPSVRREGREGPDRPPWNTHPDFDLPAFVDLTEISLPTTEEERSALLARQNHLREQVTGPSPIGTAQSRAQIDSPMAPTAMNLMPMHEIHHSVSQNRPILPRGRNPSKPV